MDSLDRPHLLLGTCAQPESQRFPFVALRVDHDVEVTDLEVHDWDQADAGYLGDNQEVNCDSYMKVWPISSRDC